MKLLALLIFVLCFSSSNLGQLQLGPLTQNPFLTGIYLEKEFSIDSTFVYATDTITLPFFDDFTTNKIQQYAPDFDNPLTTSVLYYYLIDQATTLPISNGIDFTNQVTLTA